MSNKSRGFTLIELLVAMTIIAVLSGLALVSYQGARKTARDGKRKVDLETIRSALEMCYADTNSYPSSITGSVSCGDKTYLSPTPIDPSTKDDYDYSPGDSTYSLCASLETDPDEPYCLTNP